MNSKQIKFTDCSDVQAFVSTAEKCNYDVDISYGRIVIDAKSLLGVMSMDLRNVLTVRYCKEDTQTIEPMLNRLAV